MRSRLSVALALALALVLVLALASPTDARADAAASSPEPISCLARWYTVTVDGDDLVLGGKHRLPLETARTIFAIPYRTGPIRKIVDPNEDPGRTRIEALFDVTYGADAKRVEAELVPVKLGPVTLRIHRKAAPALRRVAARLDATQPALQKSGGTFVWRLIAGTGDRSTHSWGIALDLDPALSDYWRDDSLTEPHWRNRIPQSIVDAFEAEGFIWGGRWYHYDTMHFEYRPELLSPSCGLH